MDLDRLRLDLNRRITISSGNNAARWAPGVLSEVDEGNASMMIIRCLQRQSQLRPHILCGLLTPKRDIVRQSRSRNVATTVFTPLTNAMLARTWQKGSVMSGRGTRHMTEAVIITL